MGELARRAPTITFGTLLAIAAGYTVLDQIAPKAASLVNIGVGVFVQYAFLAALLAPKFPPEDTKPRYGSMLGMSLFSGLGIVIGFVLLIVPGIYVAARWSLAGAFVVARHERAAASLSASWEATRDNWWPFVLVYLVGLALMGASIAMVLFAANQALPDSPVPLIQSALTNLLVAAISVGGWLVAAAGFQLLVERAGEFESVFS